MGEESFCVTYFMPFIPLYILITLLLRWTALPMLSSHYIGGTTGDSGLYVWLVRSFADDPVRAFHSSANAFYPYGLTRAWSDLFLVPSFIASLFIWSGCDEVLAYNIVLLFATFLNGFCTYLLARKLNWNALAAFLSGAFFMMSSYFTAHMGHPQLQFAFFIPLVLTCAHAFMHKKNFVSGFAFGFSLTLALTTSANIAVISGLCALLFFIWSAVLKPAETVKIFSYSGMLGSILGILPSLPFISAYLSVSSAFDARKIYEAYAFSASPLSYLSFSPLHPWFNLTSAFSHSEAWLGSSVIVLLAGLAQIVLYTRKFPLFACLSILILVILSIPNVPAGLQVTIAWVYLLGSFYSLSKFVTLTPEPRFLLSLGIFFLVLALGPILKEASFWAPWTLFYHVVPGMNSIRAVSRLGIVVLLVLSLFAGQFVAQKRILALFLLPFMLFETTREPYALEPLRESPSLFSTLKKTISSDDAVIVLPVAESFKERAIASWSEYATLNTKAMNWMVSMSGHLVNGYSGQRPRLHERLPYYLRNFPDAESVRELSQIYGLRYILDLHEPQDDLPDGLELLQKEGEFGALYKLTPKIPLGHEPNYLLLPAKSENRAIALEIESPLSTCFIKTALAESTDLKALRESLRKGRTLQAINPLTIQIPESQNLVRPVILALSSDCDLKIRH